MHWKELQKQVYRRSTGNVSESDFIGLFRKSR